MTRRLSVVLAAGVMLCGASVPVLADDLSGSERFLCSAALASDCEPDGVCSSGPGFRLNIPQFIEVDLAAKRVRSTAASGEARSTEIRSLERVEGLIVMQGYENERAFSVLVREETGLATMTITLEERVIAIFGACTPLDTKD